MGYKRLYLNLVILTLTILLTITVASASDVTRSINKVEVYPHESLKAWLTGTNSSVTKIVEEVPPGFRITSVTLTNLTANYEIANNVLTINISSVDGLPFKVEYNLVAPTSEGSYKFNGRYYVNNQRYNITGISTVHVTAGILIYDTDVDLEDRGGI